MHIAKPALLRAGAALAFLSGCGSGGAPQLTSVGPMPAPTPTPTPTPKAAFTPQPATIFKADLYNQSLATIGRGWQCDFVAAKRD